VTCGKRERKWERWKEGMSKRDFEEEEKEAERR
jgi:hypothetical protein